MPDLPKISVVTPTFNSVNTLKETLESVHSQGYADLEHVIMDGGSTDGTLDVIKDYPQVIVNSGEDEGHYDAMNKGIARSSGDVISILNSDDCFRPGALMQVGQAFAANESWAGLFGDVVYVDGDSHEIFRRAEARFDYNLLRYGVLYVIHPTLFLRRSVYDSIGTYRHTEYLNACDVDLILRIGRAGLEIGHIDDYIVNYRFHAHGQSADRRVMENTRRETESIQEEHGKPTGLGGRLCRIYAKGLRQLQKLFCRGRLDIIPGRWRLRGHFKDETEFSSNIGVDKL